MTKGQKSFVKGAAILGFFGLIVKLIGMLFRIPLTNIIGAGGMANYHVAYPIYAALVVISTAGLPTAISRMVSERVTLGDYQGAHQVFKSALRALLFIGVLTTLLMLALSGVIARAAGYPDAVLGLVLIAPSLFFVALLSAYRGYFQGLQMMFPTAITQLIEQLIKLGAGLFLAWLWSSKGTQYGAAGALLGISISEVCALLVVIILYNRKKSAIQDKRRLAKSSAAISNKAVTAELFRIAIPIIVGASVMPLVGLLDTLLVKNLMVSAGFSDSIAEASFGVLSGSVNPLINMPAVLSLALCMSLVPAISEARVQGSSAIVSGRSGMGFKLAILVGLPCAVGMYILADPIMKLLYTSGLTTDQLVLGGQLLRILSVGVLFLTILQTMTGILQGAGHQLQPVVNLSVGAAVKIALSIVLIRDPALNVQGAAIGTAVCYGIAAILNVIAVSRITKPDIRFLSGFIAPLISTAVMGAVAYFLFHRLSADHSNAISTLIAILAAALVYIVMLFITGSLKRSDMEYIPGGGKMIRLMNKLGFWR
jgi:stage V sporulation protein B